MIKVKVYLIIFILPVYLLSFSQKPRVKNNPTHDDRPLHFGFSLGLNYMDYHISHSKFAQDTGFFVGIKDVHPGINIQAIANLRLGEYFDLRCLPGISFGERQVTFLNDTNGLMYDGQTYQLGSSFLELPLSLKYKAKRMNNFRPYLLGGVNLRYDLAIKKEYDEKEQLIMLSPLDWYTEAGMGFDFYLTYFKFSIELKYSLGMTDIFRTTNPSGESPDDFTAYTDMIDKIRSSIFQISFHFE